MKKLLFMLLLAQGAYAQQAVSVKKDQTSLPKWYIADMALDTKQQQTYKVSEPLTLTNTWVEVRTTSTGTEITTTQPITDDTKVSTNPYHGIRWNNSTRLDAEIKKLQEDMLKKKN